MKVGKIVLSIFFVLILAVGVGLWYLFTNINSLVKDAVETVGSDTLQTSVKLGAVDIKLVDGSGELNGFSIANYPGFNQPKLLSFDSVKVDIDTNSIRNDVIVIEELTIRGVDIVAEQLGKTTNLQAILDKIKSSSGEQSNSSSASSDVLLAVKKLNFLDGKLTLATEKYGTHSLALPEIKRTNIGTAQAGLTPEQLAEEITRPLIDSAKKSVERGIAKLAEDELEEKLDAEKERLKEKVDEKFGEGTAEKLKDLKKLF